MKYTVIENHESGQPNPIKITKGTKVKLGHSSTGVEKWDDWRMCYEWTGIQQGWVPEQLLTIENGFGIVLEDYSADELNVRTGDIVHGVRELNGWIWCTNSVDDKLGWLPKEKLKTIE